MKTRIEFVISGNGKFAVFGSDGFQKFCKTLEAIDLSIHKIACRNQDVGFCFFHFLENPIQPLMPHNQTQMDIGNLDDG